MSRRKARETALQVLFQVDIGGNEVNQALDYTAEEARISDSDKIFTSRLVKGVLSAQPFIDSVISELSHDWKLDRIAGVDRNIMRIALYEVLFCHDIPVEVSLNEAVELAKIFGSNESGRFVNGILGKVVKERERYMVRIQFETTEANQD